MAIAVKLDDLLHDRRMTLTELADRIGMALANLSNLKSVVVTINDRGPYVNGRIIDLSRRAASVLGFVRDGVARVRVEPLLPSSL